MDVLRTAVRRAFARASAPMASRPIQVGLLVLSLALAPRVEAQPAQPSGPAFDPSIGRVEVTLDLPKDKPYVGEMIMLRMRSFIRADVVLNRIDQPPLLNFSWQQLGRDKPIEAMIDGFSVAGIERDLAIFPTTSGRLIVEPFLRHVTIVTGDNQRIETEFASKPIYVDIQNYTAISPPGSWWLPAKSVTLTDSWSETPDEIKPGTLARRTITVEALGLTGDRLPPPPDMQAPGTIAFRGPVDRQTTLTEDGPLARGTYIWDIRPVSASPAKLPPIHIAWFDTQERRMRDRAIPELWIALVGTLVHPTHEVAKTTHLLSAGPVAAGLAGFAWMATVVGFALTSRRPLGRKALRRMRALAMLRRRARSADEPGFSRALVELARSDAARWREVSGSPEVAGRLADLDRARFGRAGGASPDLKPLARDIRRLWLAAAPPERAADGDIAALDGDVAAAPRSFRDRLARHR